MTSHLSDIGFDFTSEDEFVHVADLAIKQGIALRSHYGQYVSWRMNDGAELWVLTNRKRQIVGMNPYYNGKSELNVGIIQAVGETDTPLEGGFLAWANPSEEDVNKGDFPFVFDVPDFDLVCPRIDMPARAKIQLVAFAHRMTCFKTDQAFLKSKPAKSKTAPESVFPVGTLTASGKLQKKLKAEIVLSGHVIEAEMKKNSYTEKPYQYLYVKTLGGRVDVVADPKLIKGNPTLDGVMEGTFWLTGRFLAGLIPPSGMVKRLLQRLFKK